MTLAEAADQAYAIAVEECAAPNDDMDRQHFIDYIAEEGLPSKEYRCCYALGFGGKLRYDLDRGFFVDYYLEDETPEREAMQKRANERLARLNERIDPA